MPLLATMVSSPLLSRGAAGALSSRAERARCAGWWCCRRGDDADGGDRPDPRPRPASAMPATTRTSRSVRGEPDRGRDADRLGLGSAEATRTSCTGRRGRGPPGIGRVGAQEVDDEAAYRIAPRGRGRIEEAAEGGRPAAWPGPRPRHHSEPATRTAGRQQPPTPTIRPCHHEEADDGDRLGSDPHALRQSHQRREQGTPCLLHSIREDRPAPRQLAGARMASRHRPPPKRRSDAPSRSRRYRR